MNRTTQIVIGAVAALALAGGGFVAGMTVAQGRATSDSATATTAGSPAGATGAGAQGRRVAPGGLPGGTGAQAVAGRVLSVNADSITIEIRQPGAAGASPTVTSTIALVGASTRLVRTVEQDIKLTDVKAGDQVTIVGTSDPSSGTVSAQAIVVGGNALQQILGGGQRPGGAGGAGRATPSPTGR